MGSACGKSSSQLVEPEANPEDLLNSGDLVLMRLATQDKDGLCIPVDIMRCLLPDPSAGAHPPVVCGHSELETATLGDQVSQRSKKLPRRAPRLQGTSSRLIHCTVGTVSEWR